MNSRERKRVALLRRRQAYLAKRMTAPRSPELATYDLHEFQALVWILGVVEEADARGLLDDVRPQRNRSTFGPEGPR